MVGCVGTVCSCVCASHRRRATCRALNADPLCHNLPWSSRQRHFSPWPAAPPPPQPSWDFPSLWPAHKLARGQASPCRPRFRPTRGARTSARPALLAGLFDSLPPTALAAACVQPCLHHAVPAAACSARAHAPTPPAPAVTLSPRGMRARPLRAAAAPADLLPGARAARVVPCAARHPRALQRTCLPPTAERTALLQRPRLAHASSHDNRLLAPTASQTL